LSSTDPPCLSEFTWNRLLFSTTNIKSESMYWDCSGRILKCINGFLQESLVLNPIMILTAFFWSQKICKLYEELPPKHYSITKKGVKVVVVHTLQCFQRHKWSNASEYIACLTQFRYKLAVWSFQDRESVIISPRNFVFMVFEIGVLL